MVARKSTRRRNAGNKQTTPRHLWLAAIGAVAVARREALTAAGAAIDGAGKLRGQLLQLGGDLRDVARGAAMTVQEALQDKVELKVDRLKASNFSAEVEARLAPVLAKFGVDPGRRKPARKARKTGKTGKTGKTATRRSAAARKQAGTRVARKGRG